MTVIDDGVNHNRVEDGLIAQHGVLNLLLALTVFCNIRIGADDVSRNTILVASEDGHDNRKDLDSTCLRIKGLYLDCLLLNLTFSYLQQGTAELLDILRLHTVEENGGRLVVSLYLSFVIIDGNGFLLHIERPEVHLPRAEDMRQTGIATTNGIGHLLLTEAVKGIIAHSTNQQQNHSTHDEPYPNGDATVFALRVEPLVLERLQLVFSFQTCIDLIDKVQQDGLLGNKLILTMLHLDRCQFQIIEVQCVLQPFQRQRIPYNLLVGGIIHMLHSLTHVVIGDDLRFPPFFFHQVVSKATFVHNETVMLQIGLCLDAKRLALTMQDAMGKYLDDGLTRLAIR